MVDELKRDRIKVQQTLHGYNEGHRLIDGSAKLVQADARIMLLLSDASGSGTRTPSDGYLTGYPLQETGKYVLARTWAAPEMSRPGCVWTHSLLIDFADLARLASVDDLLRCFVRPSNSVVSAYGSPMEIAVSRSPAIVAGPDLVRAGQWMGALYGKPRSKITGERKNAEDDALVVAIWVQQWPRLRRAFRFCTFAVEDRSTSADVFDLQLVDSSRSSRARMPNSISASAVKVGGWIEPLLDDLSGAADSGLRRFLRDVGADISGGRAAMAPLTRLYVALDPHAAPELIVDAVAELELLGPHQARMGRAAAARNILSRSGLVDGRLFDFALDEVRSASDLLGIDPVLVGKSVLRRRPGLLGKLMSERDSLGIAVAAALHEADADHLVDVLQAAPDAAYAILSARPEILERENLWRIQSINAQQLLLSVNVDRDRAPAVVTAMIAAGQDDCASLAVERFGIGAVVRALSESFSSASNSARSWLAAIAYRPEELSAYLADGTLTERQLLTGLAQIVDPDAVPNSVGQDPWITAVQNSKTSNDNRGEDHLAAFLFSRAMGWRSKSPGRLLLLSVQRLHDAMAAERLSDAAWRLADRRLPWVSPWREWDRCERLRRAVVDHFIDRDLSPIEFARVVDDARLWAKLVVLAAETWRGRRYLDRVRMALRGGSDEQWGERARVIDRALG